MAPPAADGSVTYPEPLNLATKVEVATLEDVPDPAALSRWLLERGGLATESWGQAAGSKGVKKFWKELQEGESGLELWRGPDGAFTPVRTTHVLRAKVCSPQSYGRGMFLFNTWQQMADGTRRLRNGLLSEKLMTSEVPLRDHLKEVCHRAVTQEEMQRVVGGSFSIDPGTEAPDYDAEYQCPITVEREIFLDYTTEVETSKSYPGLLTLYHLYTVEIICNGLPGFDFNTLEYDHPDKDGHRRLKYVHAWVWLEWSQIRRYLFEGSTLKERKTKGSFPDPRALSRWLGQFDLDLDSWGTEGRGSAEDLFNEVEDEETQLELWNREDGVPLLMRVVHVLQLKVTSSDKSLFGKFLFQSYTQDKNGRVKPVNRLMSKKLSSAQMPFDESRFKQAAEEAVKRQLTHLMDAHFHMDHTRPLESLPCPASGVRIRSNEFKSHHFDVEDSPFFKGMHTMYHLYVMELECEKLPTSDFTSLDHRNRGTQLNGWKWVCWPECLDLLHHRILGLERQCQNSREILRSQRARIINTRDTLEYLERQVQDLEDTEDLTSLGCEAAALLSKVQTLTADLHDEMADLTEAAEVDASADPESVASMLPPSMVSKMASLKITSDDFLEEQRMCARRSRAYELREAQSDLPALPSTEASPSSPQAAASGTDDTDDMPQRRVPPSPGSARRQGLLILGLCATEAALSLLLASKQKPRSLRLLLCGAIGLLGSQLL